MEHYVDGEEDNAVMEHDVDMEQISSGGYFQSLLTSVEASSYENCNAQDRETWENLLFATAEAGLDFYESYAKSTGFKVRIRARPKTDSRGNKTEKIQYMHFVCSKEGYKSGSALDPKNKFTVDTIDAGEKKRSREKAETRCGCLAYIRFKLFPELGCYKITDWHWEHNHGVHPACHSHLLQRKIAPVQALIAEANEKAGIPVRLSFELLSRVAGGSKNFGFRAIDLKNHLLTKRQIALEDGEGTSLLEFFREESLKKPDYFYSVQVDADEDIAGIFWSDGLMSSDYSAFGDVVSFDTTFSTNNLYRPLAAFIGFNHHRELCIFGCALLLNETSETFCWLFNTFKECMSGKLPKSIFTDQCAAIRSAINSVLPEEVFHGLCSWHITENAKKNLGCYADSDFLSELDFLITGIDTPDEFDFNWNKMIAKCFNGRDEDQIRWLGYIRDFKHQWSSAWVKEHFTAGLKSTQLSESFNALVKKYIKHTCSLSEFFERFNTMVTRLREKEITSNYNAIEYFPKNHFPHSTIMQHASEVYTPSIFNKIHQEFEVIHGYYYDHLEEMDSGDSKSFCLFQL